MRSITSYRRSARILPLGLYVNRKSTNEIVPGDGCGAAGRRARPRRQAMTCHATVGARAVTAAGNAPQTVLGACLDQLEPLPPGANLGIVYGSEPMAPMADDIVRALRARTGIEQWLGACGAGVLGGPGGASERGLAVLTLKLPAGSCRFLPSTPLLPSSVGVLLAHAEIGSAEPAALLAGLARHGAATMVGGLSAAGRWPVQIAGAVMAGGVACLGFSADLPVVAGVATAGSPLGPIAPRHERRRRRHPGTGWSPSAGRDGRGAGRSVPACGPALRRKAVAGGALGLVREEWKAIGCAVWPRPIRRAAPCGSRAAGQVPRCG